MSADINLLGVLVAGLSSMVVGAVYYSDGVFGKRWRELANIDPKKLQKAIPRTMPLLFFMALITAYVVACIVTLYHSFYDASWLESGVVISLLLWVGVSATTLVIHESMEGRSYKLTYISLGNRLLSLLAMGLIIGWLHP